MFLMCIQMFLMVLSFKAVKLENLILSFNLLCYKEKNLLSFSL